MSLFQPSVLKKYSATLDAAAFTTAWQRFRNHFGNAAIQENIRQSKEEQYQEGFLNDLFVSVLGYTLNPQPGFNLTTEQKNEKGSKKADGAILKEGAVLGVIELKGTDTTDLAKIESQAFNYLAAHKGCTYVITANFEKLRFYIQDATEHEEFHLFSLTQERFRILYLLLQKDSLLLHTPLRMKEQSVAQEDAVTKKLYADYSAFKTALYADLVANNKAYDRVVLFQKTQKLLDRFLFVLFAEDRALLPPNSVRKTLSDWQGLKELDEYVPLYNRFKKYFGWINTGFRNKDINIFAYNGGLFMPDEVLDAITITDDLLYKHTHALSNYDFESEVDVNILGHIFEHSLNEIEGLQASLTHTALDATRTRRKKEGVFYTPRYITRYIVAHTVGALCTTQKAALGIIEEDYAPQQKKKNEKALLKKLVDYRNWLLHLTILDPACGSGAFLNAALEFLIAEHSYLDELTTKLLPGTLELRWTPNDILEQNLYGVDINDEAVEIARLSLWLRTARPERKLSNLSSNIKCGNSLIDDPAVAGAKAFRWEEEFADVFANGGFDVVIGNPPYGAKFTDIQINYYRKTYNVVTGHSEAYYLFFERAKFLITDKGLLGFIIPNAWFSNKYAIEIRRLLLNEFTPLQIINFNQKVIFEDANVETAIYIGKYTNNVSATCLVGVDVDKLFTHEIKDWYHHPNLIISFNDNHLINSIFKKVNYGTVTLASVLDISNGFKPYQVGYGTNQEGLPLNAKDVECKIYHSNNYIDGYKKEIKGKGVKRYSFDWEESYIKWGKWLMSPKDAKYFENPKILIRQIISNYFYATIDKEKYYADQSLYICINYVGDIENTLTYYLALINSKLYGFYFRKYYSEEDDLFPKVKVNELKSLPIKKLGITDQQPFIALADTMLTTTASLQSVKASFINFLQNKFPALTITKKLADWPSLLPDAFLKELAKGKVTLTLSEQRDWIALFEDDRRKAAALQATLAQTDAAIDRLVYALYGLTPEEIAVVEGK